MLEVKLSEPGDVAKNTRAIADAIEQCSKAGGGRVVVPAGEWVTGPIKMASRVELHVSAGATLRFSRNRDDFPLRLSNYEGLETYRCTSPIWGDDLTDVSITGSGTIDGSGEMWRSIKRSKRNDEEWAALVATGGYVDDKSRIWYPTEQAKTGAILVAELLKRPTRPSVEEFLPARDFLRPNMIQFTRCKRVTLDGPTFRNSPAWNIHLLMCDDVLVKNTSIYNDWWAQNGDGIDIESCRNVLMGHCAVDAGDDAICLKSGRDEHGRQRGRATENVTIHDCVVKHGHGGVVVGSEMSGGVRNVFVRNCLFDGTDIGLRFKSKRGRGGLVENIDVANVVMRNIRDAAIGLNLYYQGGSSQPITREPVNEGTPRFRALRFANISCESAGQAIELRGLPEMPVESVAIESSRFTAKRGAQIIDARRVSLRDVTIEQSEGPAIECTRVTEFNCESVSSK